MMSLQYENLYNFNKPADGLEAYCRLEGLDPLYVRSLERAERNRDKSGARNVRKLLSRLSGKSSLQGKRPGYGKSSGYGESPGYGKNPEQEEILKCRKRCEC